MLTEAQRTEIVRSPHLYTTHFAGTPRADYKLAARTGGLDHLYAEHVACVEAVAAEEKLAKRAKNDAWRAKNLPGLVAAKAAREQAEADEKIARVRAFKNAQVERDMIDAAPESFDIAPAVFVPSHFPVRSSMPTTGTITEDDPSVWGEALLGHDGESWASFHAARRAE